MKKSTLCFVFTLTIFLSLFLISSKAHSLGIYSSETDFFAAAQIVSTETFDRAQFVGADGFHATTEISPLMTLSGVVYQTLPSSFWWFISPPYVNVPSPPNALIGNLEQPATLSFGAGRCVNAFGFYFGSLTTYSLPTYRINILETDGTNTVVDFSGLSAWHNRYFGFVSSVGIESLTVGDIPKPPGSGGINWWYDNVSRSEILGRHALRDNYTIINSDDTFPPGPPFDPPGPPPVIPPVNHGAVPLPSAMLLLGAGLGRLALYSRRKQTDN